MSLRASVTHRNLPGQSVIVPWMVGLVTILALPSVTFVAFPTKLTQATAIDPWVYLAYINDFGKTTARFGMTYYGDRIAYIMAEKVFFSLLGPINGYLAFAYLLLAVATAAVYSIGNRFYGYTAGFAGACWLCLLPWLPRSVFHTYVDGPATTYLLIAIALLIVPVRLRLLGHALAGAVFALAVNCNFLLLAIGLTLAPGWLYLNRAESLRWFGLASFTIVSGFVAAYLGLGVLMHIASDGRLPFFFDLTAVRMSLSLLGGQAARWFIPLHVLLSNGEHYYLLVPPVFLCAIGVIVIRSVRCRLWRRVELKSPLPVFAAIHLALIILLSLFLHNVFDMAWLALDFYTIYFLPGCVLVMICLVGEADALWNSVSLSLLLTAGVVAGPLLLPLLWPEFFREISTSYSLYPWCFLAGAAIVVAVMAGRSTVLNVLVTVLVTASSLVFYSASLYAGLIKGGADNKQVQWEVYDAALFLQNYIDRRIPTGIPTRFWYRSKASGDTWIDSVQSMFLWQFSRVASLSANDPGMPVINAAFYKRISGTGALVLLGESAAELNAAEAALAAAQVPFKEAERSKFAGKRISLFVAILFPKITSQARYLPLDTAMRASNAASIKPSVDGVVFRSVPVPWSYVALMPLRAGCLHGGGWIAADIQVTSGTVGVGVLNRKGDDFLTSGGAGAAKKAQTIILWLDSFSSAGDFVIRNWDQEVASEGTLRAVQLDAESGPTPPACDQDTASNEASSHARPSGTPLQEAASGTASEVPADAVQIAGVFGPAVLPGSATRVQDAAQIDTPAQPWAYAAQFPLQKRDLKGPLWVRVHANISGAPIGIGVLNGSGNDFLARTSISPGDSTVTLRVPSSASMGDLIVQSWDQGKPARAIIESITVLAMPSQAQIRPAQTVTSSPSGLPADAVEIHDAFGLPVKPGSKLKLHDALPAEFATPPQPWGYAAQFPLHKRDLTGPLWVRVHAKVSGAPIGIGVLNRGGNDFVARISVNPGDSTVTLSVPSSTSMGDLIIQSWDRGRPARAAIESIAVLAMPSQAQAQPAQTVTSSPSGPPADAVEIHDAFGLPVKPGSKLKLHDAFPAEIATPPQPWAYAAEFPVREGAVVGPVWIRIRINVKGGPIGIGVLNRAGNGFLARVPIKVTGDSTITLPVAQTEQIGDLVVQSWDEGKPGDVTIDSVTVMRRQSPLTAVP